MAEGVGGVDLPCSLRPRGDAPVHYACAQADVAPALTTVDRRVKDYNTLAGGCEPAGPMCHPVFRHAVRSCAGPEPAADRCSMTPCGVGLRHPSTTRLPRQRSFSPSRRCWPAAWAAPTRWLR